MDKTEGVEIGYDSSSKRLLLAAGVWRSVQRHSQQSYAHGSDLTDRFHLHGIHTLCGQFYKLDGLRV